MENMDTFEILTDTKLAFLAVVLTVVPDFFVVAVTFFVVLVGAIFLVVAVSFLVVVGTLIVEACLTNLLLLCRGFITGLYWIVSSPSSLSEPTFKNHIEYL